MTSADLLCNDDRCPRLAHWSQQWENEKLHPNEILRRAVNTGLVSGETDDPGQTAGDEVMTFFAERPVETEQHDQFGLAMHTAALADIIVSVLRGSGEPWDYPEDSSGWVSGLFIDPPGVRLRRICIVSSLSKERLEAEKHSWRTLDAWMYEMPLTLTFVVIGQERNGRHTGPWSKGWVHPVGNQNLRFKKRDGSGLSGAGWLPMFREQADLISRDHWIERMREDDVLSSVCFDAEIAVPDPGIVTKVKALAEKKLGRLAATTVAPEPSPSQCHYPVLCQFESVCWQFRKEPSERDGFIRLP